MLRSLFLVLLLCSSVSQVAWGQSPLDVNFDEQAPGTYTFAKLLSDFQNTTSVHGVGIAPNRLAITSSQDRALSVNCDGAGIVESGAHWIADLRYQAREAYLSYRIRFEDGFDFTRGVKLPGLIGGVAPQGATQANGVNGWMTRMTLLPNDDGGGDLFSIAKYHQSGFASHLGGEDFRRCVGADGSNASLETGRWYTVLQRVRLNRVQPSSQADGILQVWIDGELVLDQQDVEYRTQAGLGIGKFNFSCYMNGGSAGPIGEQFALFDDIKVTVPSSDQIFVPNDYPTISAAVDNSNPGDRIFLRAGTHNATTVKITHPLTITGTPSSDVQGTFSGPAATNFEPAVFHICSANVKLETFNILDGNRGVLVDPNMVDVEVRRLSIASSRSGIRVEPNCHRFRVVACSFNEISESDAISLSGCDDVLVSWNNTSFTFNGWGYCLENCDRAAIQRNTSFFDEVAFKIIDSEEVLFTTNVSDRSEFTAALFLRCRNCLVLSNEFFEAGRIRNKTRPFGSALILSTVDSMFVLDNDIDDPASHGIDAFEMTNSVFRGNSISGGFNSYIENLTSIRLEACQGNRFVANRIEPRCIDAFWAIEGSVNNTITRNVFDGIGRRHCESSFGDTVVVREFSGSVTTVTDNTIN